MFVSIQAAILSALAGFGSLIVTFPSLFPSFVAVRRYTTSSPDLTTVSFGTSSYLLFLELYIYCFFVTVIFGFNIVFTILYPSILVSYPATGFSVIV